MTRFLALIAALTIATAAFAHSVQVGDLEIIHPHIPAPAAKAMTAAAYMGIFNAGDEADRLIGIETPIAKSAMLHESKTDANGVATMTMLDGVDVPAQDTAVLEPGGIHVMLMGLTGPLVEGDVVPAVLIFEHAGRVEITIMIDPADGTAPEHSMDDMGD